jgi:hypothetical protein
MLISQKEMGLKKGENTLARVANYFRKVLLSFKRDNGFVEKK